MADVETCVWCDEELGGDDPCVFDCSIERWRHFECHVRSVVGSVAHQEHRCGCCNSSQLGPGEDEYPSRRSAARAAMGLFFSRSAYLHAIRQ